jgi:calcium release-activated calcium channel protein 1
VLLNIFALMISTFILPSVEAITHQHGSNLVEHSPHEYLRWYIEIAWVFSTVLGMFVFLFEVIILSWTKFWDFSFDGAAASTGIILISMVVFVGFTAYFYYTLVDHKCETTEADLQQLDAMQRQLDVTVTPSYHLDVNYTGERLV